MNLEFIASNLADAQHDLRHLLNRLGHPDLNVSNFKVSLEHILYHLLLAWNARHLPHGREDSLSDEDYDRCLAIPLDLAPFGREEMPATAKRRKGKFDRQWARRYLHRHWTRSKHYPGFR